MITETQELTAIDALEKLVNEMIISLKSIPPLNDTHRFSLETRIDTYNHIICLIQRLKRDRGLA